MRALEVESYLQDEYLDRVGHMLSMPRWTYNDDPELTVLEARLLLARGQNAQARVIQEHLAEVYPRHPSVMAFLAEAN